VTTTDKPPLRPFSAEAASCMLQIAPISAISCADTVATSRPDSARVSGRP
jgi:hypothetical protein